MKTTERAARLPTPLIVGSSIGMCGGLAVIYMMTFGVFVKPIIDDLGWSRAQVSLIITSAFFGYAIGSPVVGRLFDHLGAQRILTASMLILAIGVAGLGMLHLSPVAAACLSLVMGFAGTATAPSGYVLILARATNKRLGLTLALAMLGYGVGIALGPLVAQRLIAAVGWREAYLALAAISLTLGSMALLLGVGRAAGAARQAGLSAAALSLGSEGGTRFQHALGDYRFWIIGGVALMLGTAGFGVTAHLAAILSDRGLDALTAARATAMLGGGMFMGRIAAAALMDRIFAPLVAATCSVLGAIGLVILLWISAVNVAALFFAALLVGLLTGSEGDTMPFLTRRYFGTRAFGSIFGCIVGMGAVGGILGPFAFGRTFDVARTYSPILMTCLGLCILSSVLLMLLGPYRYFTIDDASAIQRPAADSLRLVDL